MFEMQTTNYFGIIERSAIADTEMRCVVAASGTTGFRSFAANLLRIRKIEAQIAQESVLNREGFRASLTNEPAAARPNLANVYNQIQKN